VPINRLDDSKRRKQVKSLRSLKFGEISMIMDYNAVIANILSHITLSNVRGVESADKWKDVISEFFCQAADDGEDGSEVEDMVAESDDD